MAARSEASAVKHVQLEVHISRAALLGACGRCWFAGSRKRGVLHSLRGLFSNTSHDTYTRAAAREMATCPVASRRTGSTLKLGPASPPPRGLFLGKRVATTSVALAGYSGQPDSPRSGVPRQRGEPGPTRRAKTHCKGIEGPIVNSRGGTQRPVTAQRPANLSPTGSQAFTYPRGTSGPREGLETGGTAGEKERSEGAAASLNGIPPPPPPRKPLGSTQRFGASSGAIGLVRPPGVRDSGLEGRVGDVKCR